MKVDLATVVAKHRETGHVVTVGRGPLHAAIDSIDAWNRSSEWTASIDVVQSTGRTAPFRKPFVPVCCPSCLWAGLNLGIHHARVHGGPPPAGLARVAAEVTAQARAARATSERNRSPRVGVVVVRQTTDRIARVYRIDRLVDGVAHLYPFAFNERHDNMKTAGLKIEPVETLLAEYLPVGRWSKT